MVATQLARSLEPGRRACQTAYGDSYRNGKSATRGDCGALGRRSMRDAPMAGPPVCSSRPSASQLSHSQVELESRGLTQ